MIRNSKEVVRVGGGDLHIFFPKVSLLQDGFHFNFLGKLKGDRRPERKWEVLAGDRDLGVYSHWDASSSPECEQCSREENRACVILLCQHDWWNCKEAGPPLTCHWGACSWTAVPKSCKKSCARSKKWDCVIHHYLQLLLIFQEPKRGTKGIGKPGKKGVAEGLRSKWNSRLREYRSQSLLPLAGFCSTASVVLGRLDSLKDSWGTV